MKLASTPDLACFPVTVYIWVCGQPSVLQGRISLKQVVNAAETVIPAALELAVEYLADRWVDELLNTEAMHAGKSSLLSLKLNLIS